MNATRLYVFFCRQLECLYVVVSYFAINLKKNRHNACTADSVPLALKIRYQKLLLYPLFSATFRRSYDYVINLNEFQLALFIKILKTTKLSPQISAEGDNDDDVGTELGISRSWIFFMNFLKWGGESC